jgi:predicted acylesterase/phospholipase RssA
MNKKIGIVHAGGGAKGSFGIGVLENLLKKIKKDEDKLIAIAGTSIGAMNMAFVASNQFEDLKSNWLSWNLKNCPLIQYDFFNPIIDLIIKDYMYKSKPLFNFFKKNLNVNALINSEITYLNNMVRLGDGEMFYGGNHQKNKSEDLIIKEIMASMAFIPGTPAIEIDNVQYVDGGFRDTVMVKGFIENNEKIDHIYIINLNPAERKWDKKLLQKKFLGFQKKLIFLLDDILWYDGLWADIEIGQLKYWNPENYTVISPNQVYSENMINAMDFDDKKIKKYYEHGLEISEKLN